MKKERANIIRAALEKLRDKNGTIRPSTVVRAARSKTHPLHPEFEWDIKKAAQLQWEDRAYELIHTYCTVEIRRGTETIVAPLYARDPRLPKDERGLVAITHASLEREDARAILLHEFAQCAGHVERARNQAAALEERFPGFSAWFDRLLAELLKKKEELRLAA